MLAIIGVIFIMFGLAASFFGLAGISISLGFFTLGILCALGAIEKRIIKLNRHHRVMEVQLEELIELQKATLLNQGGTLPEEQQ